MLNHDQDDNDLFCILMNKRGNINKRSLNQFNTNLTLFFLFISYHENVENFTYKEILLYMIRVEENSCFSFVGAKEIHFPFLREKEKNMIFILFFYFLFQGFNEKRRNKVVPYSKYPICLLFRH